MKKISFSILLIYSIFIFLPTCRIWGQSKVMDIPAVPSDTSIVRYWTSGKSIVYSRVNGSDNYFLLVDEASDVLKIKVPIDAVVRDFRIMHDTVFFVGYYYHRLLSQQYGLLACFAIHDFYNGAGIYDWMVTTPTPMPDCYSGGCQNIIVDIMRLAVFDSSGCTKIGFVAKNYICGESMLRVGVGSAKYNATMPTTWNVRFIYNKYAIEEYTDIIATHNYVVAVARTNDSARLALRIYPKNDFISMTAYTTVTPPPLPSYYYHNKYGQGLADLEVEENVMATALDGDEFAVAYHYSNLSGDGLALKTFYITSGQATLTQGLTAPIVRQPGSVWKMRDLCYSSPQKKLSLLNDSDGGTVGSQASIIYHFQLPLSSSGTYYGRYQPLYTLSSLDSFGSFSDAFISSGNRPSGCLSLYWEKPWYTPTCFIEDSIPGYSGSASLYTTYMVTNINEPYPVFGTEPFSVEILDKLPVCEQ